jgi:hypothetical protein
MIKTFFSKRNLVASGVVAALGMMTLPVQSLAADTDTDTLFKESMYLRETGKTYSAIEGMESILQNQPTLERVRLELAVSYYRVMNYERAKAEAKRVLDDPKTPENVKLAIQVFLAQVEQDEALLLKQKSRFEPSISAGLLYDSNINAGPGGSLLPGGWVLSPSSVQTGDWATVLQAGISHTYQSPNPVRVGEDAARFLWKSQANIYQRSYNRNSNYNLTIATLATGPAWLAPNKWRANVNFQIDNLMQGGHELAVYSTVAPSYTWQLKSAELTTDLQYTHKTFILSGNNVRNSDYVSGGLSFGKILRNGKTATQVGARLFNEDAKTPQYTNHGYEWFAGVNYLAWTNGNIYARYTQDVAWYDVGATVTSRQDYTHQYEVGFGHHFKTGKLNDWNLNGSWTHIENNSDDPVYKYQRDLALLTIGRTF